MRLTIFLSCLISFSGMIMVSNAQKVVSENYFRAPLDIPLYLSGNFGELRADHFHSGIDIKTQGVTGHKVYAAADGYISRIKIESGGYGRTIYINHPRGYTTVYAHLNGFTSELNRYVRNKQYKSRRHAMNIYPEKNQFLVKKGEVIAYSGNSGYSFGPHLHFEIRDASNQNPMNVLSFGFNIKDNIPPVIYSLYIYPIGEHSILENQNTKISVPVNGSDGQFALNRDEPISASGNIGIGLEAYDYLNGSRNRCGIYITELYVNGFSIIRLKMDEFSFSESRYINSLMDYEEKNKTNRNIFKTFIEPNNNLSIYESHINSGVLSILPDSVYNIRLVLKDVNQNSSELSFTIHGAEPSGLINNAEAEKKGIHMSWKEQNSFVRDDLQISLPPGSFYSDIEFTYSKSDPAGSVWSDIHHIHNRYTPVHLPYELKIKPLGLPPDLSDKALLVSFDEEDEMKYAGGEWKDGWVSTTTRSFGRFAVACDTIEPEIEPLNIPESLNLSGEKSIRFKVTDDLSGIQSYEGYINNEWALFEYDAKNDLVYYTFDDERVPRGSAHELELYIIDNKDNIAFYYTLFNF